MFVHTRFSKSLICAYFAAVLEDHDHDLCDVAGVVDSAVLAPFEGESQVLQHDAQLGSLAAVEIAEGFADVHPFLAPRGVGDLAQAALTIHEPTHVPRPAGQKHIE